MCLELICPTQCQSTVLTHSDFSLHIRDPSPRPQSSSLLKNEITGFYLFIELNMFIIEILGEGEENKNHPS